MLTVTQLAKAYNISRTTILYYERAGLLLNCRSDNGYRWYGEKEQIAHYLLPLFWIIHPRNYRAT